MVIFMTLPFLCFSDEINLEGKRDFKIYVEKRSNLNIFVMISHSSREGITVHNGKLIY